MLLALRKCKNGCMNEFFPPSYDLRSPLELEAFFCDGEGRRKMEEVQ
jgi:hypothetical protein